MALKFAISFAIPDTPHEVQIAKAKILYESNQALRREVRLFDGENWFLYWEFCSAKEKRWKHKEQSIKTSFDSIQLIISRGVFFLEKDLYFYFNNSIISLVRNVYRKLLCHILAQEY